MIFNYGRLPEDMKMGFYLLPAVLGVSTRYEMGLAVLWGNWYAGVGIPK